MTDKTLKRIERRVSKCEACRLCETRKKTVPGVGNPEARLMFIGEGPGANEDKKGEPFVGRAGKLLDKMIAAMGLSRERVFITNIVKCLKGTTRVYLGDGSSERIDNLVRAEYRGTVMSFNESTREYVKGRVLNTFASPRLNRPFLKVSYEGAKGCSLHTAGSVVTHDHMFLTRDGWVEARYLSDEHVINTGPEGWSDRALSIIYGTILGDSHIQERVASISASHSLAQEEWLRCKANILGATVSVRDDHVRMHTPACRHTADLRKSWYDNRQKCLPNDLRKRFDWSTLATWFLDDGHTRQRSGRKDRAEICCTGFTEDMRRYLVDVIKERTRLDCYEKRGRIHFSVSMTSMLLRQIGQYVPPSMRYKLGSKESLAEPYNPDLWLFQPRVAYYRRPIVESFDGPSAQHDRTVYCLEVENHNNFLTPGGLVHNCRPPGNRDPRPDEVAACSDFLVEQIETIQPEAIVTLGKPASQKILGSDLSMGQLRRHRGQYRGTPVFPVYHPAYLLRNPSAKRDAWTDLKRVMAYLELE